MMHTLGDDLRPLIDDFTAAGDCVRILLLTSPT
jgi:hypothetical protein